MPQTILHSVEPWFHASKSLLFVYALKLILFHIIDSITFALQHTCIVQSIVRTNKARKDKQNKDLTLLSGEGVFKRLASEVTPERNVCSGKVLEKKTGSAKAQTSRREGET